MLGQLGAVWAKEAFKKIRVGLTITVPLTLGE